MPSMHCALLAPSVVLSNCRKKVTDDWHLTFCVKEKSSDTTESVNVILFPAVWEVAGSGCMWERRRRRGWDFRSSWGERRSTPCHHQQQCEGTSLRTSSRETGAFCETPGNDRHRHVPCTWRRLRAETEGVEAERAVWKSAYSSRQSALYPGRKRSACEYSGRVADFESTLTDGHRVVLLYHIDMDIMLHVEVGKIEIKQIPTSLHWSVEVLVTVLAVSLIRPLGGGVRPRRPTPCRATGLSAQNRFRSLTLMLSAHYIEHLPEDKQLFTPVSTSDFFF